MALRTAQRQQTAGMSGRGSSQAGPDIETFNYDPLKRAIAAGAQRPFGGFVWLSLRYQPQNDNYQITATPE